MTFDIMTEPSTQARNAGRKSGLVSGLLLLILIAATMWRLFGVKFGLPALNDPDEPLFMMTAFDMLRNQTFNPGWFGHPGTTTLYCISLICLAVGGMGLVTGRFDSMESFATAVYADPGIVFLPARLFIVLCGVACVLLTYRLGKRLGDARLGLFAATFLSWNAIHIEYSQIVRTDMQASVFMLLCTLSALSIGQEGKMRDYVLAGLFVGLATATKWPAALIALNPLCAWSWRAAHGPRDWRLLALFLLSALVTLCAVSPYLLLDYPTVLRDLSGEARPIHPGATGGGFLSNLAWYVAHPLAASVGIDGLALALFGLVWAPLKDRWWLVAVLPGAIGFLVAICAQALFWERWIVPVLPFILLAAAYALCRLGDFLRWRLGRRGLIAELLVFAILLVPMTETSRTRATERTHDTRQIASGWIRAHTSRASTLLVEDAAIDLLHDGRRLLFPLGSAGCIDAQSALAGRIHYAQVETLRASSPIVDLGHMDPALLPGCRADYALLTHYERYRTDPNTFSGELARYQSLLRGARLEAVIRAQPGASSGPVVYIFKMQAP